MNPNPGYSLVSAHLEVFLIVVILAVHHQREQHRQDGVVCWEVEAELHDIPYRVFEGEFEVGQLGHLPILKIEQRQNLNHTTTGGVYYRTEQETPHC